MKKMYQRGLTLIELMIVIVIVAILGAIGFSSYQNYVMRGRRQSAQQLLQRIITQAEQYYVQNNNCYPANLPTAYAPSAAPTSQFYTISLTACSGATGCLNCVQASAIPFAGSPQKSDTTCDTMILDTKGNRTAVTNAGVNSTTQCWTQQ